MVEESSRIWCLQESKLIQLPSSERSWYLRFLLFPVRFWSSCQTLKRLLKWSKFTVSCLRSSKRLSCRRSRSNRTSAFKHLWVFLSSAAFLWSTPNYLFFKYQFNEILIQLCILTQVALYNLLMKGQNLWVSFLLSPDCGKRSWVDPKLQEKMLTWVKSQTCTHWILCLLRMVPI